MTCRSIPQLSRSLSFVFRHSRESHGRTRMAGESFERTVVDLAIFVDECNEAFIVCVENMIRDETKP